MPIIITEPALGYGGGLATLWFEESLADAGARGVARTGRQAPPAIGALAAFSIQKGSSGGFAGYFTPLAGDRYRLLGWIGKVALDLDYCDRKGRLAAGRLEGQGLLAQGLARTGDSDFFIGARYVFIDTTSTLERERVIDIPKRDVDVRIGRLSLIVDYESRDNFFTPSKGAHAGAEFAEANEGLGGNVDFRSFFTRAFQYIPVGDFVIGLRGDYRTSSDSNPFFPGPSRNCGASQRCATRTTRRRWSRRRCARTLRAAGPCSASSALARRTGDGRTGRRRTPRSRRAWVCAT